MDMGTSELRYLELKNKICYQIYNGVYEDGERIPSERQLAADYDVSRITVRKAGGWQRYACDIPELGE